MLADAIQHFHDLLTPAVAADAQGHLERQTEMRSMNFGARPVCSVLRPRLLSPDQYRFLCGAVKRITGAFAKIYRAGMADADFRRQFRLTPNEETLLTYEPGFADPSPTSRLDSFFVSERELKFTEYNSETPAGAGFNDALTEMYWGSPAMREFRRRYRTIPLPAKPHVLDAVIGTYREWAGNSSTSPRIAIVDWNDVPTVAEFREFQRCFRDNGYECEIIDPRDVEYANGSLVAGGYRFNLIYKRVLISELIDRGGMDHPIVRAVRDRAVCFVNGFRCKLLFKKASFAVLSDERNAKLLSADELAAVRDYIPWTRLMEERHTTFNGEKTDLVPFVLRNRERLVLKPNDDYGGHGITLGWTADDVKWEAAVRHALTTPYVVQEKVGLPREVFPSVENGRLQFIDRMLDTNPFVLYSAEMDACLTRISTEALLNVTAGGGSTVPTLIVDER